MEIDAVNKTVTLTENEAHYLYTVLSEQVFKSLDEGEIDMLMKLHRFLLSV